ncbi:MAG: hypothetical protein WC285_06365 [Candidatus Gracilibacteria bacterium]|jgi:hypothetical protein
MEKQKTPRFSELHYPLTPKKKSKPPSGDSPHRKPVYDHEGMENTPSPVEEIDPEAKDYFAEYGTHAEHHAEYDRMLEYMKKKVEENKKLLYSKEDLGEEFIDKFPPGTAQLKTFIPTRKDADKDARGGLKPLVRSALTFVGPDNCLYHSPSIDLDLEKFPMAMTWFYSEHDLCEAFEKIGFRVVILGEDRSVPHRDDKEGSNPGRQFRVMLYKIWEKKSEEKRRK